ncbi:branched-chain amino acid ABC transporter ATP-binding protein [Litchfieldella anticariensis FP35 = DSM 16096]|uniref:Branched-chain amino acid ABC transporter ATP-binding protein n=1 Tax=Litchfieldella anticariensis (strain DSM 16096 / CECT 5854 / CIP 108499 / LMG 22089 / FP35) TaxID=1121939 RepID=S2KNL1_LITA3|nr:ABC transporter ATP-binding protein [Halomonas anticariensis]EPC03687.1 branched-chain amino acid ABC transporter ATP-binding protein [Halomonas anticariensis FP35 = DSM 16096]
MHADTARQTISRSPLVLEGLVKNFGGVTAVAGVDLEVASREVVGVIGPNGSGKSTLFNLIAGMLPMDEGRVWLDGKEVTGQPAWRIARAGLARTFQIPSLFDNISVHDNLMAAAVESGDWKRAPHRAKETMEMLEISHVADNLASELSGGQQKLLEFGRVCMRDPSVILLDEATAGVHPNIRRIMLEAIRRVRDSGATFLVIEHDMEMVREICDRIVVMDAGQVVAEGSFDEIADNIEVQKAYLGRQV